MIVDFRVTFDEEVSDDQALSVLKNVVKDGKLGTFKVNSTSVKSISPTAEPRGKYILENLSCLLVTIILIHPYTYMGLYDLRNALKTKTEFIRRPF